LVSLAKSRVVVTEKVGLRAVELEGLGFKAYDADGVAEVLLTTDDRFLRKAVRHRNMLKVRVDNPVLWLMEVTTDGAFEDKSDAD